MEPQTILDVAGAVPQEVVESLLRACKSNNFTEVQQAITDAIADGFPVSICVQMPLLQCAGFSSHLICQHPQAPVVVCGNPES